LIINKLGETQTRYGYNLQGAISKVSPIAIIYAAKVLERD
jgi:hypothetical protein